ncbi:hypothetical protein E4P42_25025 [Mycobacterium sp. PS03-16]|nr:hypothetical protein E4P42_25025 [Mycobacterium sp. PS03-16]
MPALRFVTLRCSAAAAASVSLLALGAAPAMAAPPSDAQGFVDSTARCAAPDTAVVFGRTDSSRVAVCESPDGALEYRGVRVRDGARLITSATADGDGGYVARTDGATYTVSADALTVSIGDDVVRAETMLEFHGDGTVSASPPAAAPTPTPTTPLPPPLPAEVGGSASER